jgi:hypothetical protein
MVLQFINHLIQARVDEVQMAEMIREVSAEEMVLAFMCSNT